MKNKTIFSDFRAALKTDLLSGFLVSLIALPLSLGIAAASGFPPIMGVMTAIVGGIIVTFFMGAEATIKGPAAGLIVILAGSVAAFKDLTHDPDLAWKLTAAVVVVAGLIQIVLGFLKVAKLVEFFPVSAVHGMLAAIGLIIIVKQLPVALGDEPTLNKGKDIIGMILNIPLDITHETTQIAIIGIVSIAILFSWTFIKNSFLTKVPAAFIVLVVGIILGQVFDLGRAELTDIKPLVKMDPVKLNFNANFSVFNPEYLSIFIKFTIMMVLIGSLESLLSAKAIDLIDPEKRKSNLTKDFWSVGIGNTIAGFLGGLPMISEIVRSSANLSYGGRRRWANFFHGCFLLLYALILYPFINMVPMASLGAMMIFAGYRLASPKEFSKTYNIGWEQLTIFVGTIIITLSTDLLIGVFSGIAIKIILQIIMGVPFKHYFGLKTLVEDKGENHFTIHMLSSGLFTTYLGLEKIVHTLPASSSLRLDVSKATYIDHTFMEKLHELSKEHIQNGGSFQIIGMDKLHGKSQHPHSARKLIATK